MLNLYFMSTAAIVVIFNAQIVKKMWARILICTGVNLNYFHCIPFLWHPLDEDIKYGLGNHDIVFPTNFSTKKFELCSHLAPMRYFFRTHKSFVSINRWFLTGLNLALEVTFHTIVSYERKRRFPRLCEKFRNLTVKTGTALKSCTKHT